MQWRPGRTATAALAAAIVTLSSGCMPAAEGRTLALDEAGFRLQVPDGWDARATRASEWQRGRTVAILSNRPLDPQCAGTGDSRSCQAPVAELDEGALLVWWQTTTCAGNACRPPDGEALLVGGRAASLTRAAGACEGLRATDEEAYIVSVSPQRLDAIVACERNAGEAVHAQLRNLLEGVDWRTP
jgi:hypothetical protein